MSAEVTLGADAGRALKEAENCCWRANVAIVAAEHILAGALVVLRPTLPALPSAEAVEAALLASQGAGSEPLTSQVMFGSSARDAISMVARWAREAGIGEISAQLLAIGVIESGEIGPMFFSALGADRKALKKILSVA